MDITKARADYLGVLLYAVHTVEHKLDFSHGDIKEDIDRAYKQFKEVVENGSSGTN